MADDIIIGRVLEFTKEHGFGKVVLPDGRELPFDVTACTQEPRIGEQVRVRVGISRLGKEKAIFIEPVGESEAV